MRTTSGAPDVPTNNRAGAGGVDPEGAELVAGLLEGMTGDPLPGPTLEPPSVSEVAQAAALVQHPEAPKSEPGPSAATNAMNQDRLASVGVTMPGHGPSTENADRTTLVSTPVPTRSALSFERFCQIMNCQVYFDARTSNKAPWTGRLEFSTTGAHYEDVTADTSEAVVELVLENLRTADYSGDSGSDHPNFVEEWRLLGLTAPLLVPGFIDEPKVGKPEKTG